jgi:hypothetical protein
MRIVNSVSVMALSTAFAPIPILALTNAAAWLTRHRFEPFGDNALAYLALLVIFAAGATTTGMYHWWQHGNPRARPYFAAYAVTGAVGSAAIMILADLVDDYVTGPGIGLVWPTAGLVLGFAFGAMFRAAYGLLILRHSQSKSK